MKAEKYFKSSWILCVAASCVFRTGIVGAVEEPNDVYGICYTTSGTGGLIGSCPAWFLALDRNSTDTHTTERLFVELDVCQVFTYEITSVQQGAPLPEPIALEPDDFVVVWDEDAGHGEQEQAKEFDFTGEYLYVTNPDTQCPYVRVSSTNDEIINWAIYKVLSSGELTITGTGINEHDVFQIHRNIMGLTRTTIWMTPMIWTAAVRGRKSPIPFAGTIRTGCRWMGCRLLTGCLRASPFRAASGRWFLNRI